MASCASPVGPVSPLGAAIEAIDGFTGEEREVFFSSLDQLPNFDSPAPANAEADRFSYDIEEDDWKWLATQVGGRTQQELAQFAHSEYERMALEDPDLVRAPPHALLLFPSRRSTHLLILPFGDWPRALSAHRMSRMEPRALPRSPGVLWASRPLTASPPSSRRPLWPKARAPLDALRACWGCP